MPLAKGRPKRAESIVPSISTVQSESHASLAELSDALGFAVSKPRVNVDPYHLESMSALTDPEGFEWGLLEYTDGLETLFLLVRPRYAGMHAERGASGVVGELAFLPGSPEDPFEPGETDGDFMTGYHERSISVVQADLGNRRYVAVGRVPVEEIRWWLESLPLKD